MPFPIPGDNVSPFSILGDNVSPFSQIVRRANRRANRITNNTPSTPQTPISTPYLTQYKALVKQRDDIKRQIAAVKKQPQSQQRAETLIALNRQLQSVIDQINAIPQSEITNEQRAANAPAIENLKTQSFILKRRLKASQNQRQVLLNYLNNTNIWKYGKIISSSGKGKTGVLLIRAMVKLPTDPDNPAKIKTYMTGDMTRLDRKAALGTLYWNYVRPVLLHVIPQIEAKIKTYQNALSFYERQEKTLANVTVDTSQQNATSSQQLIANREKAMYNMRMKALQNKQNKQQVFIG